MWRRVLGSPSTHGSWSILERVDTVPAHESTYSHPRLCYAASMPVLSDINRRRAMFTIEILISSISILLFSELVSLTISKETPISAIEIRNYM
jgi:hypothetical protein